MIQIRVSQQQKLEIKRLRDDHPHPTIRRRMDALWLKAQGLPHQDICRIVGISNNTLCRYLRMFESGALTKVQAVNFYTPTSELDEYRLRLASHFREHPPTSIKEAMEEIEKLTGLKRSVSAVGKFLTSIGMRPRKVGAIPSKADPEVQEEFKNNKLDPVLQQATQGKRAVYFVDAAHFVWGPFLGVLWSFTRLFLKAPAGRKRFNVLGALNAITHELILITNDTYINAESVCQLLQKIALQHIDTPITLVLDNARYQKCKMVDALAASLNIDLLFLPTYSPNLNLIERLWKFVKKEVLYSKYYSDFGSFKQAISGCLNQTHTTHKEKWDSLLTLKFQLFKNYNFVPI